MQESAAEPVYLDAIASLDAECVIVRNFKELYQLHSARAYSGLLVDIVSSIKASTEDRAVIKELMEVYPSLRLRWDPESGEIRTLMTGAGVGQKISIAQFVDSYCTSFTPQALRLYQRREIHCSVLCSVYQQMPDSASERTVTVDLSVGGCFLYFSYSLDVGTTLWLRFVDFADNTPIKVEVVWCRDWGKSMKMPGAGVRFIQISEKQLQEIAYFVDGAGIEE
ncbi:MAG: hypothetical protein B6I36_06265 [Desulfobacteraceae bacterium 4572_35.1]|nr:MAG: hypothetical protein B6I36_06265 [Desulfobacteraceae bacterium 4572_35.1]